MTSFKKTIGMLFMGILLPFSPLGAQQAAYPVFEPQLPVVSVNRERLIQSSDFGRMLIDDLSKRQSALVAENESLTATLEKEELELTELRKTVSVEEFAPLAESFDEKVKNVRRDQEQKAVELAKALENTRFSFFRQAETIIVQMMQERGIVFVLDENAVWLSRGGDVTKAVIDRLNVAYKAGELTVE